jgi:hypothetical protein
MILKISNPNSISFISDWIELYIATKKEFISKAKLTKLIEKDTGEEPRETFICDVWNELYYRTKLYNICPFQISDSIIEFNPNVLQNNIYLACLIIAIFGVENGSKDTSKVFERVVCNAAKHYLSGDGVVFGWPVTDMENISIKDRIIELSMKLNERYVESPPAKYKDRGVDVVAWKPFSEKVLRRPSQVVLLLQCAAGQDWRSKTGELPIHAWEQYIHWSCNPIKAFAIPHIISKKDWHEISKEGGILFDRIRIVNLISNSNIDMILDNELSRWIDRKLKEYEIC